MRGIGGIEAAIHTLTDEPIETLETDDDIREWIESSPPGDRPQSDDGDSPSEEPTDATDAGAEDAGPRKPSSDSQNSETDREWPGIVDAEMESEGSSIDVDSNEKIDSAFMDQYGEDSDDGSQQRDEEDDFD